MTMRTDLVTLLKGVTALNAITGNAVEWFEFGRGDTGGQIRLSTISPGRDWTLDGPSWLDRAGVQFDLRSNDPDQADTMRTMVLAAMEAGGTAGGTIFHPAQLEGEREVEPGEQPGGESLFGISLDFSFYHEETA